MVALLALSMTGRISDTDTTVCMVCGWLKCTSVQGARHAGSAAACEANTFADALPEIDPSLPLPMLRLIVLLMPVSMLPLRVMLLLLLLLLQGTLVTAGRGRGIVVVTGGTTAMGKIRWGILSWCSVWAGALSQQVLCVSRGSLSAGALCHQGSEQGVCVSRRSRF